MFTAVKEEALCGRYSHCLSYYLSAVIEVSKAVQREVELESILSVIVEHTAVVMEADRCTVFVYDDEKEELWSYVGKGLNQNEIRFPVTYGIAGYAARTRQKANIPDAYDDERFNKEFDLKTGYRTRSVLCQPMINNEETLVGVLQVINKKDGLHFDENDEMLIESLAAHVSIAIERAFLTEHYIENKKNQEMMNLSHDIQMGMLPNDFSVSKYVEIHAFISPTKEVGGDFYDFHFIAENLLCFTIGDVSDKGVPAALFMMMVKTLFRALSKKYTNPADILKAINSEIAEDNETMMFVTMFVGVLDINTGKLLYCSGGHNPPFILTGGGTAVELETDMGPALGLMSDANFKENTVTLDKDNVIFTYTDGVDEAKDGDGKMFTLKRLKHSLCRAHIGSLKALNDSVLAEVGVFTKAAPQSDDITILSVKYLGNTV
ncbi:MAG: SpoIIE family protein phosphatase [Nitrospirae bacterium]|nr:SpoIIE family protein phosphatase [Nitrospirota bacterium]MBF0534947.1 SpoIIE family protein phosphatase [Nitrospirota bacterium]MBF0617202.1 SpoIIE family protein phosphatase [Nitrospirota bacterium]